MEPVLYADPDTEPLIRRLGAAPWSKRFDCGLELRFEVDEERLTILADVDDPEHVRYHLKGWGLSLHPRDPEPDRPWQVWRQDDNGNDFLMMTFATERGAHCIAHLFEARGHKQHYWVVRR